MKGPTSPRRPKILVVEDDEATVALFEEILGARWQVIVARDVGTAEREWARAQPDAIVLDIRLGGVADGVDVFQRIRQRIGSRPPTLVVSAADEADDVGRALQVPVLRKPFKVDHLVAAVEAMLARPEERQ